MTCGLKKQPPEDVSVKNGHPSVIEQHITILQVTNTTQFNVAVEMQGKMN